MTDTAFTPGPWKWDAGDVGQDYAVPYCDVYADDRDAVIASVSNPDDAPLIAAAPDLYEALKALDDRGHTMATWELAKRALAKARGEVSQ
ncbi:hypothetical protein [Hyphomicrobium sp. ghe19]|uniref:hypothetical protein n=1 Tax=Hyphomicrobium sp. ghe19 TaxID=2682968 RepID=UPI0013670A83|nr:hypothetical protein HYPP_01492 [Hyphomicrobium sp. ghe19]